MARARLSTCTAKCHSCGKTFRTSVFAIDEGFRALHTLDPHKTCSRCSWLHAKDGEEIKCRFLPESCGCATPHIEVLPDPSRDRTGFAQVRAEQRAVVYRMPDGSLSAPPTNHYDDPVALAAVAAGGVRDEAYHVSDMRRWHHDSKRADNDDFTDRNLVIDYDRASILAQDHYIRQQGIRGEDEARQRVYDRQRPDNPIRVYFDNGARYEEAKRRSGRG